MPGRVVLVTGGSRGIGLACARRLQRDGERVAVTYRSDPPALEGSSETTPLLAVRCDVTSQEDVTAAFATIEERFGTVEVLVSCAGVAKDGLLMRMAEEQWQSVIDANLTASFRVAKRALPAMLKARSGRIILISSVVALTGNAGQSNYAAAKAGLVGLARSLAREVAPRSVTVNVIAPGLVDTDMLSALSEDQLAALSEKVPLGRLATPEEVAAAVAYVASPEAAYVTGAVIPVDGGLGMGH